MSNKFTHANTEGDLSTISFVVLDFETATPKGRSPEPIELAAMRIAPGFRVDPKFKIDQLISLPKDVFLSPFDTAQTGIRADDLCGKPIISSVLSNFQSILQDSNHVLVAHNARYEASILRRFDDICPVITSMSIVDTVQLAKYIVLDLPNYKLDTIANYFHLPLPVNRHRALPDVELTVKVFLQLLELGSNSGKIQNLKDLLRIAGLGPKPDKLAQMSLF